MTAQNAPLHLVPDPVTVTETTVHRDGVDLQVYIQGAEDGQTVILVHGWPDDHHLWQAVVPLLTDRYRVITYDTRGHGRSTVPADVESFRLTEFADDFFAVLDAVSPDEPVHVVGHDWGSVQLWEAVCEPGAAERIASFTSISGPNLDHLGMWIRKRFAEKRLIGPLAQLASSAYTGFFMTPVLPKLFFRTVGTPAVWRRFLRLIEGTPAEQVHLSDRLQDDMISGLRIYRANIAAHLIRPRERHTEVPVQLLVNRRDIALRPAIYEDTDLWVSQLSRRDLSTGHWLPFSDPSVIAESVAEFIESR